jgi:hypothetical protein
MAGSTVADPFLFSMKLAIKTTNYDYTGCYVKNLTNANWAIHLGQNVTASGVAILSDCYYIATTKKARYFGLTDFNQCYYGDNTNYNDMGLQPAAQCMYKDPASASGTYTTGSLGFVPNFGDQVSFAMYEISYSRTIPVVDSVLIGATVRFSFSHL